MAHCVFQYWCNSNWIQEVHRQASSSEDGTQTSWRQMRLPLAVSQTLFVVAVWVVVEVARMDDSHREGSCACCQTLWRRSSSHLGQIQRFVSQWVALPSKTSSAIALLRMLYLEGRDFVVAAWETVDQQWTKDFLSPPMHHRIGFSQGLRRISLLMLDQREPHERLG